MNGVVEVTGGAIGLTERNAAVNSLVIAVGLHVFQQDRVQLIITHGVSGEGGGGRGEGIVRFICVAFFSATLLPPQGETSGGGLGGRTGGYIAGAYDHAGFMQHES